MERQVSHEQRPLSDLVAQGWEVIGFAGETSDKTGRCENAVLLRRQRQHKILRLRRRWFGGGIVVEEMDI
jgi:hypothetical protein